MKTTELVQKIVAEPVLKLGYELVDIEFQKEQARWVLTLFIDKEGGISLDDCERVSRAVEPLLDDKDPIAQSYFLCVSSPGLDRPLKNESDFKRALGKDVEIKLYLRREKKKEYIGKLLGFNALSISVLCKDGKEREFDLKEIALIRPHLEF
ncbi:MAG TPA: ribosome maturation factor RimP [Clostridia bacterium]|nr:MAG: Ribosome maturation factor RimP [Firmicutes bacterium ADurb.Bin356]HOR12526.1 ribosome maturation factor RimP [Clostridia bacterium]